jgi:hypothetical protein
MRTNSPFPWLKQRGQTLIIALIVLFVLLLIGFVFIGILNRNIVQANTSQQRSLAADLSDGGITYAQSQLLNNPLGADWRPVPTQPLVIESTTGVILTPPLLSSGVVYSRDPDLYWIRPAPIVQGSVSTSAPFYLSTATTTQYDMGGPDGLGPFSRIQFRSGRALIRVRYAPSDIDVTAQSASLGPIRQPGKTHNFIIIESVGRPGVLNANDPTSIPKPPPSFASQWVLADGAVAYQFFGHQTDLQSAQGISGQLDSQNVQSRKLMAFASIGIIDHALFVTNVSHTSTPADIGIPFELGLTAYSDTPSTGQVVQPPAIYGSNTGNIYKTSGGNMQGGGSIYINDNVLIYGQLNLAVNTLLGEGFFAAGTIGGVNAITGGQTASVNITSYSGTGGGTTIPAFNPSTNSPFDTKGSIFRDNYPGVDGAGNPRGVPYKEPPDITHNDPDTGYNRYVTLTRDSGTFGPAGNNGQYGHGKGVYVNNAADLQTQNDETGRLTAGSVDALFQDWLNPNSGQPGSAWQGPYYVPPAAYLQLEPDGFFITLDGSGTMPTWRDQSGNDTGSTKVRYRVGGPISAAAPQGYIIDSYENLGTVSINDPTIVNSIYTQYGQPFSGVLYFEGNVRLRGVTPTVGTLVNPVACPITIVSMGNIYIEGSITKGVEQANGSTINVLGTTPQGGVALLARDYVVLNTTQFFGPADHPVTVKNTTENPAGVLPVMMPAANGEIDLMAEFLLDPSSGMGANPVPSGWSTFASEYTDPVTATAEDTNMLLTHTMDEGPGSIANMSLAINSGATADANYVFGQPSSSSPTIYTLGQENYQRYTTFESIAFPLLPVGSTGTYALNQQLGTPFQFYSPPFPST